MSALARLADPVRAFMAALARLNGGSKRTVMMSFDGAAMLASLWLAFCIRLGGAYWPAEPLIFVLTAASIALSLAAMQLLGVYKVVVRYIDVRTPSRLAIGAATAAGIWFILAYLSRIDNLPRSVGFIYFGLLYLSMFFGRLAASRLLASVPIDSQAFRKGKRAKPIGVAIHGANAAGSALADSLRRHPEHRLRFFVDDNPELIGRTLVGYAIKSPDFLRVAVEAGEVEQVFLAMPSASRSDRLTALSRLREMAVKVMTVPSYEEIMSGRYAISDVRPIRVEDLLKRNVVPPLRHLIEGGIREKSVLVTGAGGSIGSEICRQTILHGPRRLVLVDHSEFALYAIESELRNLVGELNVGHPIEIVPVMGSLLNERLLTATLRRCETDTVFHAAAYKHVPLLEQNEVVGVENNVVGTRRLADACIAAGVARMTMISTDKAVRPTNVMGASKRVAELYIQAVARAREETAFGIVRFGNVLDSSGSVVQQFRRQIRAGGPVTVTHEEITRFFMSIPEATQLVLQANSMASRGEVFVLDMGEPVRITELARTMIALSGLTERTEDNPEGDIEIRYVGLRPGEKLHEELFIGEEITDTEHPQIKMAEERSMPLDQLVPTLKRLENAIAEQNAGLVRDLLTSLIALDHRMAA